MERETYLTFEQIKLFFERNNIPLKEEYPIFEEDVDSLLLEANAFGKGFAGFVLNGVINSERNGIQTNFSSYEELYDCYLHYICGFTRTGINN